MKAFILNIPFKLKRRWRKGVAFRTQMGTVAGQIIVISFSVYLGIKLAELL